MARPIDKDKAINLRLKGFSYSQIRNEIGISKSTLSGWLKKYPLSDKQIRQLNALNPQRIEKCRNTKIRRMEDRLKEVFSKVKNDIGVINEREILIAGMFLYWGEGSKSERWTTALSNTDPAMLRFFIKWVRLLGIKDDKFHITLQLYSDMDINKEIKFWSKELRLPKKLFKKPYVKESTLAGLSYKRGFGHGTCNIRIFNRDLADFVHMGMKYITTMDF